MLNRTRILGVIYGGAAFVFVHVIFLWFILFLANISVVPSADSAQRVDTFTAVVIDVGLIILFGLQHSVMARPRFKSWWSRIVPKDLERSTYVHAANLALVLLLWLWQPISIPLWHVTTTWLQVPFWFLFVFGWALSFAGSILIDHFELLGMRQCLAWYAGTAFQRQDFQSNSLYLLVRNPIQLGLIIAFWASPIMTVGHALLATGLTIYISIAIRYEERDLALEFGESYLNYRKSTPKLIPRLRRKTGA